MSTMVLSTPERSLEQRFAALELANEIRTHRADLKRKLKAGRIDLVDLMADEKCDTMKLFDVLIAMPKVGRVKANRILAKCQISPSKTLGGLTYRQRHEILKWLPRAVHTAR